MNNLSGYTKKESLSRLELSNQPTIEITEQCQKQIYYLQQKCNKNEWSGELITREVGSINDIENWKIIAEAIFLTDVGTAGYTSYEVDKGGFKSVDIVELFDAFPGLMDGSLKNHHIHDHHTMGAYFSGTDWEQLEDRAALSNYFLMLIVDYAGTYKGKVAFKAKKKAASGIILEFSNNQDGLAGIPLLGGKDEEVLVVMDCKISYEVIPVRADEAFQNRYDHVVKAVTEEKAKIVVHTPGYLPGNQMDAFSGGFEEYSWKRDLENDVASRDKKIGKLTEMTDKEFQRYERGEMNLRTWDMVQAKQMINACIGEDFIKKDVSWPMVRLEKLDKYLKRKAKREEWLEDFQNNIVDGADILFANMTLEDYAGLFEIMIAFLTPYKATILIAEMIDCIEAELQETYWEITDTQTKAI